MEMAFHVFNFVTRVPLKQPVFFFLITGETNYDGFTIELGSSINVAAFFRILLAARIYFPIIPATHFLVQRANHNFSK